MEVKTVDKDNKSLSLLIQNMLWFYVILFKAGRKETLIKVKQ